MSQYRKTHHYKQGNEALVWIVFDADHSYNSIRLSHETMLNICKTLKETCQISSMKPLLACVRHHFGLGFIQTVLMGIYLGTETYLITPVEYFTNTASFYLSLSRYKIENVYMTDMMLLHATQTIKNPSSHSIDLSHLKNLMVGWPNRPSIGIVKEFIKKFQVWEISSSVISNVYQHMNNPLLSLRSYLSFEPVNLWIDPIALSQGYISLVNPNDSPNSIQVQDSGVVSVNTQIVIVNPETKKICKVGEFGEIWSCSESTTMTSKMDHIEGWNEDLNYFRTGDLGFLHNVTKTNIEKRGGAGGGPIELQLLFNLGKIEETFEHLGLLYFVQDIEYTIESVFYEFVANSMVCKIGSYVILMIESLQRSNKSLSSLVPLFVDKILSKFSLVVDIVVFADLPVSRIGENQRYKTMRRFLNGTLKIKGSYGVNFGENSSVNSVKLIDSVIRSVEST
ncbi:unnamed protein product [Ambrosiozyma monospora]|uniref:Unnamed protein product n=1 Tax=Ambrosiozyma monospora TaxID=43982 RepID=A0A9W6YUF1_AMBMO|nr:unnamed protein product [Ambrosiozyma monospora]